MAAGTPSLSASALASSHSKKIVSRMRATLTASAMPEMRSRGCSVRRKDEIVENGVGRREAAEEVLLAERVDAVLDADAGIVLRQHGRRYADVPHAAVRRGRGKSHHVEQRAAADRDDIRVPVDRELAQALLQSRHDARIVLHVFAGRDDFRMDHHVHRVGVGFGVGRDLVRERRPARRDVRIDECCETMALALLAAAQRVLEHRIVAIEHLLREVHGIVVPDREFLLVHRRRRQLRDLHRLDGGAHVDCSLSLRVYSTNLASAGSGMTGSSSTRGAWPRRTELP